tara:strand:+ start:1039 stop:1335 length:297 start_codon:yes stop_codon:yes gene_type:complete
MQGFCLLKAQINMTKRIFYVSALKQQYYDCKVIAETKLEADVLAREMWFEGTHPRDGRDTEEMLKGLEDGTWQDWEPAPNEILDIGLERGEEGVRRLT